ncbi:MAG TPA: hypothetical protein PK156_10900, partial [Polyangium sp.]|nr:hypothetical protein [Polyangium sp.]
MFVGYARPQVAGVIQSCRSGSYLPEEDLVVGLGPGIFCLLEGPVLPVEGLGGKAVEADDVALAEIATTGG